MTGLSDTSLISKELENFLSYDNFFLAWQIVRNSPRYEIKDRLALKVFASKRDVNLNILIESLQDGSYRADQPNFVYTPKDDGSLRTLAFLMIRDRLVYQAIGNVILLNSCEDFYKFADSTVFAHVPQPPDINGKFGPYMFKRHFTRDGRTGQFDKFSREIISVMSDFANNGGGWIIKTDLSTYYPSIDHNLLLNRLRTKGWLTEPVLLDLLGSCLQTWGAFIPDFRLGKGLPVGYETSDLLATLFLLPMDELLANKYRVLRYVDDLCLFAENQDSVRPTLISLDQILQANGLVRNVAKTSIEPCTRENWDIKRIERELHQRLSALSISLNGSPESQQNAQNALYEYFNEIFSDDLICDVNRLKKVESQLCFILYRLKIRDPRAKKLALCIINLFPHRTIHATRYLSQFLNDRIVFRRFLDLAQTSIYTKVRLHCVQELVAYEGGLFERIIGILKSWCTEEDWQLRYEALEFLRQDYNQFDFDFVYQIACQDSHIHVRAKALTACFEHSETTEQKINVINLAFEVDHYYLKTLGLYLWSRQVSIKRSKLKLHLLSSEFGKLFLTDSEYDATTNFRKNLAECFGIQLATAFPLHDVFDDIAVANQYLLNAHSSETDMRETVKALYALISMVLVYMATAYPMSVAQKNLEDIAPSLEDELEGRLSDLRRYRQRFEAGHSVSPAKRNGLLSDTRYVLEYAFRNLHKRKGLEMERTRNIAARTNIFVSYSRLDNVHLQEFNTMITPLKRMRKIETWDDTKLRVGDKWHDEIQEALKRAKISILLVTANFLASEYIHEHELAPILRSAEQDGMRIVWVSVGSSMYETTPLKDIQCANSPDSPIASFPQGEARDKEWKKVVTRLTQLLDP